MQRYYSPSTRGFYFEGIHKSIPADSVPVDKDVYQFLFDEQEAGKEIMPGEVGHPIANSPAPLSNDDQILLQIRQLESTQTLRKIREALVSKDSTWLKDLDSQIVTLRSKFDHKEDL